MNLYHPEPERRPEPRPNPGRALSFTVGVTLLLTFIILVAGARETFVASDAERVSFGGPGNFGILTEAMRVFEETAGVPLRPDQDDIDRTIYFMTIAASGERGFNTAERILSEVENFDEEAPSGVPDGLEDIWRAMQILEREYPDASLEEVTEAARRGLFVRGEDPALTFLDSGQYEDAQEFFAESSYEGIGARVGRTDDINVISNVFIGGPAEAAGLLAGDGIVSVDGEDVTGMPVDELVEIVKGESGTEVVLEIRRPWDDPDSQMSVTVMRGVVPTSIETRIFGEDTDRPPIGYIRVERFHRETGDDFEEALGTLLARDIEGLILDVRYNPGGSLSGAVSIIGEFVPEGLAMYEMTREGRRIEWEVDEDGQAYELPLAVLVNGFSASASEVVAGALQDHGRATVYGTQTFGKGSVQAFQELSDGSALYVTVSRWHTPSGRQIQDTGIIPNVLIVPTLGDYLNDRDPSLSTAYWDLVDELAPAPAV
ncbi:MAG: S41 family peptidase [Dehalococcoidia bacterium]|nr:S41 family peptidase [Dehalococcoidia bacterium]